MWVWEIWNIYQKIGNKATMTRSSYFDFCWLTRYLSLSKDLNFKTVSDLRQRLESHINGVHLNKKPHKCPHCDFASAYQGHVKDHIRASHDAVKYPCPYPACNHQSSYKGNLDKHIKNIHASKIDAPIENAKTLPHLD